MATLIISGAGFNLFNQLGALEIIQSHGLAYSTFAGTSAGALFSVLLSMNWQPTNIQDFFVGNWTDVNALLTPSLLDVETNIATYGSLFAPITLLSFISLMIQQTPLYKTHFTGLDALNITFSQLAHFSSKQPLVSATNINTMSSDIFSLQTTPDLPLAQAILASMTLLPLAPPTVINGIQYLDGAYSQDYPAPSLR